MREAISWHGTRFGIELGELGTMLKVLSAGVARDRSAASEKIEALYSFPY
jgi:hypothetical protein